jgi:hypothetical protein
MFFVYWFVRRLVRSFLGGLNPENRKVHRDGAQPGQTYSDVQDAEFKDISDQDTPPKE